MSDDDMEDDDVDEDDFFEKGGAAAMTEEEALRTQALQCQKEMDAEEVKKGSKPGSEDYLSTLQVASPMIVKYFEQSALWKDIQKAQQFLDANRDVFNDMINIVVFKEVLMIKIEIYLNFLDISDQYHNTKTIPVYELYAFTN